MPSSSAHTSLLANSEDVRNLLGDLDDHVILDILALTPTVTEVEEAALRVEGEGEVFAAMRPASVRVAKIVELATREDEEERVAGHGGP